VKEWVQKMPRVSPKQWKKTPRFVPKHDGKKNYTISNNMSIMVVVTMWSMMISGSAFLERRDVVVYYMRL
jgi:hypothetical protein